MCKLPKYVYWIALLFCWPSMLFASEIFRGKDDNGGPAVLKLSEDPCTNPKVLAAMYRRILDYRQFKAATLFWHGRDFATCWIEQDGIVHSLDEEDSAFTPVPRSRFKDESI